MIANFPECKMPKTETDRQTIRRQAARRASARASAQAYLRISRAIRESLQDSWGPSDPIGPLDSSNIALSERNFSTRNEEILRMQIPAIWEEMIAEDLRDHPIEIVAISA